MTIEQIYLLYLANGQKITTDTRQIKDGQIYFALKGENFDGNKFAQQALDLGAKYAFIDDSTILTSDKMVLVNNVLTTLQDLSLYHRRKLNLPIIAIAGSNGKTTTKELIKEVLSQKFKVAYTKGNLNNHIGVPLTLLDIKAYEDIAIIEMGANHQGEIASYCTYTEPNFGLINNIGKAHLEGFGGIEGVIKGKTELYKHIKSTHGKIFLNLDDEILVNHSQGIECIDFNGNSDIQGKILHSENELINIEINESDEKIIINTQLTGDYNFNNIMAAYTIGRYFDISPNEIKSAIENYIPTNSRSQIIKRDNATIILDAYNANPSSMIAALQNLSKLKGTKVAFLGAMKELGEYSTDEHKRIIELAIDIKINKIIAIGQEFNSNTINNSIIYFETTEEAKNYFKSQNWQDETILIKGSRGMKLEQIIS